MGKSVTRLFSQFQPNQYDLALTLDEKNLTYSGTVTIRGKKVGRPSQRITLHAKGFKVTAASITKHDKKGDQPVELARINLQKSYDEVRLHASAMVYPGDYTLTLDFEGLITKGMTGLYPCFFTHEGQEHTMLMTQFESHHARECFPCIDEPEAKAIFDLTLTTTPGLTVLGNTPVKAQKDEAGKTITSFETTPKMSSYLLAWVVGELHSRSTKTKRGTDVAVWGTIAQPAETFDFALDTAKRSIEFFEDYFGVDYPLAKADHVAVPDFSSGAMENWGLITYRERVLLDYPGETSQSTKETIALVIAHETSHQWFGNLVTMKWWDDLWLNESFASIMEYEAMDQMFPSWHVWDNFIASDGLSALRRDSTPGVQSVRVDVHHPDEISTLFDPSIVYAKGGRLLNMMKQYIGVEAFRKGLSAYFEIYKYGNTTGADLWAALSEASGKDIASFMNPWLEQSGFPVVTVSEQDGKLSVTQQHFLDNADKLDKNRLWPVPLFASTDAVPGLLDTSAITTVVKGGTTTLINRGAHGHYIVNYTDEAQQSVLVDQIRSKELSNGERIIVLNDASMLARAGLRDYGSVLRLLAAYAQEDSEPVWDMISLIIAEVRRFIDLDITLENKIKTFIQGLVASELQRLGWQEKPDEPIADQKLRATIIALAAYSDEPSVLKHAQKLFKAYQTDSSAIIPELRSIVFGVPVKLGDAAAVDYLIHLHGTTNNSDLQGDVAAALTATRDTGTAQRLLGRLQDPKQVKPQDADRWMFQLLRNRYVSSTAWQWMEDNWQWLADTYGNDKSFDMVPRVAAMVCNTPEAAERYHAFFAPKITEMLLKRNIEIGLEEINSRITWLKRDLASVQKFFKS